MPRDEAGRVTWDEISKGFSALLRSMGLTLPVLGSTEGGH